MRSEEDKLKEVLGVNLDSEQLTVEYHKLWKKKKSILRQRQKSLGILKLARNEPNKVKNLSKADAESERDDDELRERIYMLMVFVCCKHFCNVITPQVQQEARELTRARV